MKSSFASTLLLLSLLSLSQLSSCSDIVKRSCKTAAKRDPYVDYKLCIKILSTNPRSQNAAFKDLIVISINEAISSATAIGSQISELQKGSKWENHSISCLKACLEVYSDAVSDLKLALSALKTEDFETAKTEVSSAMDAPITCEDGYKEREGEVSPLTEKNNAFFQLTAISLAFVNMLR